ncbi:MAG TPA: zinc-binding dehydrogenase [Acidimicrobiales bacterium]
MTTGRRMVFTGPGRPLECWEGEVADPGPGAVLVRTVIAGVCGTDAHRLDGDLPDPGHPVTFGHEGIGEIVALGDGVTTDHAGTPVRPGDAVYFTPSSGTPGVGPAMGWPPPAELPSPAAYQDYATLPPGNAFHRIPEGTDPLALIAFGCAMPTALGGMTRLRGIGPGQSVVVQGSGPVGLSATLLAGLTLARQVIVIGDQADRLAAARLLGATTTIPLATTTVEERRSSVLALTDGRGAEVVIECAGRIEAFDEGMGLLADEGRYVVLGIYSGHGNVLLDPVRLNNRSLAVIGSMGPTTLTDYRTTIQLARRFGERLRLAELVTHRFGLTQLEGAIDAARRGEAIKAVVAWSPFG